MFVKDFPSGKQWLTGSVTEVKGPLSYHVTLSDGRVVRRHVDHIRVRTSPMTDVVIESDVEIPTAMSSEPTRVEQPDTDQPAKQSQPRMST